MGSPHEAVECGEAAPIGGSTPKYVTAPIAADGVDAGEGFRNVSDFAAAVDRIESVFAAGSEEAQNTSAALERIAHLAFVLHERKVEASLCDALDVAVREIGDACARMQASAQRVRQSLALLHELAQQVKQSIAQSNIGSAKLASGLPPIAAETEANGPPAQCSGASAARSDGHSQPLPEVSKDPLADVRALSEEEIIALFS